MKGLTARQAEVLAFLAESIARRGYAPTFREMGERFGWHSASAANDHLAALERKGYVRLLPGVHRGIRVLGTVSRPPDAARLGAPVAITDAGGQVIARFWPVGQEQAEQDTSTEAAA